MAETARPEPFFLADDPALDMLNSVASPWGPEIEWLGDGRDLPAWLDQAGLVPHEVAVRFRDETPSSALDEIAVQARELREWFREFVASHAGRRIDPSVLTDLDRINHLLARDKSYRQIEIGAVNVPPHWQEHRHWRRAEDLLLPIAQAMGDLICNAAFDKVKHCEGPDCTLWFHDVSKNHTRRWCSMAICGNRVKAAAHRAKKRLATR